MNIFQTSNISALIDKHVNLFLRLSYLIKERVLPILIDKLFMFQFVEQNQAVVHTRTVSHALSVHLDIPVKVDCVKKTPVNLTRSITNFY